MFRLCFALLLMTLAPAALAQDDGVFEPAECPFTAAQTVDCGYLYVPEDRTDPNSDEIALAVAIIPASSGTALPDPIVYLEGGPGGSALTGIDLWYDTPYGVDRDIILIDQRGTGFSEPALYCEAGDEEDYDPVAELTACRADLEGQGIDIAAYTSATNAADIEALRVALGYDAVNLYGVSYGTRLAMTVMRDYPDGVRSVVLDSPYPPAADAFNDDGLNFYYALTTLASDCAADPACDAAYPNLEDAFFTLVTGADVEPIIVEMLDGEQELFGGDIIEMFYGYFYDTTIIPYLPALIYDLSEGHTDALIAWEESLPVADDADMGDDDVMINIDSLSDAEFEDLLMEVLGFDDIDEMYDYLDGLTDDEFDALLDEIEMELMGGDAGEVGADLPEEATGMFHSVTCAEEIPFSSLDAQAALLADLPEILQVHFRDAHIGSIESCEAWGVPLAGPIEDEIVVSDIPTLILVGQYDVATPPRWADLAAEGLTAATVLEFPGVGHSVIDATPCAIDSGLAFVNDPAAPVDASCVERIGPPAFYIP